MPTDTERQNLARLMYVAFCDLRMLARNGQSEQARDLAEAFHNIPLLMYTSDFSFKVFRDLIERYQQKHEGRTQFDYLQEWEKLTRNTPAQ